MGAQRAARREVARRRATAPARVRTRLEQLHPRRGPWTQAVLRRTRSGAKAQGRWGYVPGTLPENTGARLQPMARNRRGVVSRESVFARIAARHPERPE